MTITTQTFVPLTFINTGFVFSPNPILILYRPQVHFPVVLDKDATLFSDNMDKNNFWYLPSYRLKDPNQGGFIFQCWKDLLPNGEPKTDSGGEFIFKGRVSFILQRFLSDAVLQKQNEVAAKKEISLSEISFVGSWDATYTIAYFDDKGTEQFYSYKPSVSVLINGDISITVDNIDKAGLKLLFNQLNNKTGHNKLELTNNFKGCSIKKPPVKFLLKTVKTKSVLPINSNATRLSRAALASTAEKPQVATAKYQTINARNRTLEFNRSLDDNTLESIKTEKILVNNQVDFHSYQVDFRSLEVVQPANPVNTAPEYEQKLFPFIVAPFPLPSFDINLYPTLYVTKEKEVDSPFIGRLPPWKGNLDVNIPYKEDPVLSGKLSQFGIKCVYYSLFEKNTFMLVPEFYVVARMDNSSRRTDESKPILAPRISIKIDSTNLDNPRAMLIDFKVAPAITKQQYLSIKKNLRALLSNEEKNAGIDVKINFPKEGVINSLPQYPSASLSFIPFGKHAYGFWDVFQIILSGLDLQQWATQIYPYLKDGGLTISTQVSLKIGGNISDSSTVKLSFNDICVDSLMFEKIDNGVVHVCNYGAQNINVSSVEFLDVTSQVSMPQNITWNPLESKSVGSTPAKFDEVAVVYNQDQAKESSDSILDETIFSNIELSQDMTVLVSSGDVFTLYGINQINADCKLDASPEVKKLSLTSVTDNQQISFKIILANYLINRKGKCNVTLYYNNNTTKSISLDFDLSGSTYLTLNPENLKL